VESRLLRSAASWQPKGRWHADPHGYPVQPFVPAILVAGGDLISRLEAVENARMTVQSGAAEGAQH
jgi:hypothetical protein